MKKYLAIILGLMMIATALCGCGSDEKAKTDEKSEKAAVQSEEKTADAKKDVADKEVTEKEDAKEDKKNAEKAPAEAPEKEEKKDLGAVKKESSSSENAPLAMPAGAAGVEGQTETKYGEDDVYTNASGVPAAKTESGTEVELTGETLQELMNEYGKVTGTGTKEEKELLEKIQVLLETMPYAQSAN